MLALFGSNVDIADPAAGIRPGSVSGRLKFAFEPAKIFAAKRDKEFTLLTGAESGHEYQFKSIEYLKEFKVKFNIALVSISKNKSDFYKKLSDLGIGNILIEEEEIKLYPQVINRLKREGLIKYFE